MSFSILTSIPVYVFRRIRVRGSMNFQIRATYLRSQVFFIVYRVFMYIQPSVFRSLLFICLRLMKFVCKHPHLATTGNLRDESGSLGSFLKYCLK